MAGPEHYYLWCRLALPTTWEESSSPARYLVHDNKRMCTDRSSKFRRNALLHSAMLGDFCVTINSLYRPSNKNLDAISNPGSRRNECSHQPLFPLVNNILLQRMTALIYHTLHDRNLSKPRRRDHSACCTCAIRFDILKFVSIRWGSGRGRNHLQVVKCELARRTTELVDKARRKEASKDCTKICVRNTRNDRVEADLLD